MTTSRVRDSSRFRDRKIEVFPMTHLGSKDPVIEAYKRDLDESLIRESLKLTVQQRVDRLIALQIAADEFHQAGLRLRREKKKPRS